MTRKSNRNSIGLWTISLAVLFVLGLGCAQSTKSADTARNWLGQTSETPTQVFNHYWIVNGPGGAVPTSQPSGQQPIELAVNSKRFGTYSGKTPTGAFNQFVFLGSDIGTTNGLNSSATGTATATATQSPEQKVDAEIGINFIAQLLRGLVNSAQGTPATNVGQGTSTATAAPQTTDVKPAVNVSTTAPSQ